MMPERENSSFLDELPQAEVESNRIIVYTSLPSLQEIAGYRFICDLWSRQDFSNIVDEDWLYNHEDCGTSEDSSTSEEEGDDSDHYDEHYGKRRYFCHLDHDLVEDEFISKALDGICDAISNHIEKINLPKTIYSYLKRFLSKTRNAIDSWANYLYDTALLYKKKYEIYEQAKHVVWKYDGTINHLKTAKKMMKYCNEMSDLQKFRLMSVYCMKKKIRQKRRALINDSALQKYSFHSNPLLYYWSNYVKRKLNELKKIETRVIMSNKVDNIHAMKYFWNKLPTVNRIRVAESLIRGQKYQSFVLNRLSESEQYQLLALVPHVIIENFLRDRNSDPHARDHNDDKEDAHLNSEYAFLTWAYIKNFLANDHFVEILKTLVCIDSYAADNLTRRIWDECPDHLKRYALNSSKLQLIINKLASKLVKPNVSSIVVDVLSKVLSDASFAAQNDFLYSTENRHVWKYAFLSNQWSSFHGLFKICGGKENDVDEFRRGLLNPEDIEKRSVNFLKGKQKKEFDEFLAICFTDSRTIADYKIRLLMSDKIINDVVAHFTTWGNHWIETIDEISSDPETAYEYKKKLAFSTVAFNTMSRLIKGSLDIVEKFYSSLLNKEDEDKIKNLLWQHHLSKPYDEIFANFCDRFWNSFPLWALGSEGVQEFKYSIPIDDVFEKLLIKTTFHSYHRLLTKCRIRHECDFETINKFLLWYCGTTEKVMLYKREKIYKYERIEMITTLLKKQDTRYLVQILDWFFGGDVKEISNFSKKFTNRKISIIAKECPRYILNGRKRG